MILLVIRNHKIFEVRSIAEAVSLSYPQLNSHLFNPITGSVNSSRAIHDL